MGSRCVLLLVAVCLQICVLYCNADNAFWFRKTPSKFLYECLKKKSCECDGPDTIKECLSFLSNDTMTYVIQKVSDCELDGTVKNFFCVKENPFDCFNRHLQAIYDSVLAYPNYATVKGYFDYLICVEPLVSKCEHSAC